MALNKGQYIGPYLLIEDFRIAGGRSKISFAEAGGQRWFVKEFLSPKYPTADSPGSARTKEFKRKQCEEFESHQKRLMSVTRSACSMGSNLVCAKDLIRVGASYYKITEAIDTRTMLPNDVSKLSWKEINIILRSLVSSLRILHSNQIVHGDLKPENILIKKTDAGIYTTKLIDFDDSYFSGQPTTDRESVVGTPEYYAPEVFQYIADEDEEIPSSSLTCKADIYTLGLILCEYLTGKRPIFDKKKYAYAYAATLAGEKLTIPSGKFMTSTLTSLISRMLELKSADRPTIQEVFDELKKLDISVEPIKTTTSPCSDVEDKKESAAKHSLKMHLATRTIPASSSKLSEVSAEKPKLKGTLMKK